MRRIAFLALLLLPGLAAAQVALVTDLAGKAGTLAILSEVHPETTVQLDGSMTVLYYASGDEFSLVGPARIVFGSSEPKVVQGAPARLKKREPKDPSVQPGGFAPAAIVMRRPARSTEPSARKPELRAQIEAARPGPNATVAERVRFAAWLEQLQLKDEARSYWAALAAERPDSRQLKELASK